MLPYPLKNCQLIARVIHCMPPGAMWSLASDHHQPRIITPQQLLSHHHQITSN
jgi:hypothetical protein